MGIRCGGPSKVNPTAPRIGVRIIPDTLTVANNLAADLRALGEYEEARRLDEDILARRQRVLGLDGAGKPIPAGSRRKTSCCASSN